MTFWGGNVLEADFVEKPPPSSAQPVQSSQRSGEPFPTKSLWHAPSGTQSRKHFVRHSVAVLVYTAPDRSLPRLGSEIDTKESGTCPKRPAPFGCFQK